VRCKKSKLFSSKTLPLLRYSIHNRGTLWWKMRVIIMVPMRCVFRHYLAIMFLAMKFYGYVLIGILYILARSKLCLVVLSGIAVFIDPRYSLYFVFSFLFLMSDLWAPALELSTTYHQLLAQYSKLWRFDFDSNRYLIWGIYDPFQVTHKWLLQKLLYRWLSM
jgi:hypothetical protein